MGTVILLPNPKSSGPVRNAINERAKEVGASDAVRRQAIAEAFSLLKFGHSAAWAVAQSCRTLRGAEPAVHVGPLPPSAA